MNNNSYADILESYTIAEEGIGSFIKNIFKNKSKTVKPEGVIQDDKNKIYLENTKKVISKMQEECPDIIKKEIALRKNEIIRMTEVVDKLSKISLPAGFSIDSSEIKEYAKSIKSLSIDGSDIRFLSDLLPSKSPKIYSDDLLEENCKEWCFESGYCFNIGYFDIREWRDEKGLDLVGYNTPEEKEYIKLLDKIRNKIKNTFNGKFKCYQALSAESDVHEGDIIILLKPSDEFMRKAKEYGYTE